MHFEIAFNMGEVLNCLSFVRQLKYDLSYCIPKGLTFLKKIDDIVNQFGAPQ